MLIRRTFENLTWIDLTSPTSKEVREVLAEFPLHPRIATELLSPTLKPKLEVYDNVAHLILHFPAIRYTHSNEQNQEVDFVLSKDTLITVHYDTVESIDAFAKDFEITTTLDKHHKHKTLHAGFIFYHLIRKLYQTLQNELDFIEQRLENIENEVFERQEKLMVEKISGVSRNLLDMEQTIEGHEQTLKELLSIGNTIFGTSFTRELQDIMHDYHTIERRVRNQREFLNELRTTNDSLLTTKQNETVRTLTILAALTLPLSLLAGIFGMNTINTPFIGKSLDFWIIIGFMVLFTLFLFFIFRYKKLF